jgi:hypothetical protein
MNAPLSIVTAITLLLFSISLSTTEAAVDNTVTGTLVVVNQFEHNVALVEIALRRRFASIPDGINGHEVADSPDGRSL